MKFETGFGDLKKEWRWRGRRYLSGLLHGLLMGLVAGVGIATAIDVRARFPLVLVAYFVCLALVTALAGGAVLGRLRPRETEDDGPSPNDQPLRAADAASESGAVMTEKEMREPGGNGPSRPRR